MQITLSGIDNYTLYYETFMFILRVYVIMLFDYVYRCTHNRLLVAQFCVLRSRIITNLPIVRHTTTRRKRGGNEREDNDDNL